MPHQKQEVRDLAPLSATLPAAFANFRAFDGGLSEGYKGSNSFEVNCTPLVSDESVDENVPFGGSPPLPGSEGPCVLSETWTLSDMTGQGERGRETSR